MTEENLLPYDKKRKRLIKIKFKTSPKYGKKPEERTIEELLNYGYINLDKPSGPTSHQVDSWIKNIVKIDKVGHSGTLDPNATGILPIGLGDTTKALPFLLSAGKEYVGIMKLHKEVDPEKIKEVCSTFIGKVTQLPPVRSAVKRVKRKRSIYYLEIIEIKDKEVLFRVGCESGTYVRTLCVDIGRKLKVGAHLAELRRTRIGNIKEKDSVLLQDLLDAFIFLKEDKDETYLRQIIQPFENMFEYMPKLVVRDSAVNSLCHGAELAIPGVVELDSDIKKGEIIMVITQKEECIAFVKTLMNTEEIIQKNNGVCASLERVIMKKDTYPSLWKKP